MTLHKDETKIAVYRRHWFYFVTETLLFGLLAIFPLVAGTILPTYIPFEIPGYVSILFHFLYTLWLLFVWITFFISYTNYILDLWILTSERLVNVEQIGIFSREVSTLQIEKVQDITVTRSGILDELLGTGSLLVESAGADKKFFMSKIANAERVKEHILKIVETKTHEVKTVRIEK